MSDDKRFHDRIAGPLHKAIALRHLSHYRGARDRAEFYGADVSDLPAASSFDALDKAYEELVDEWLLEQPDTVLAIRAFLDLAIAIVTDRQAEDHFGEMFSPIVPIAKDFLHLTQALAKLDRWLHEFDLKDLAAGERKRAAGDAQSAEASR